MDNPSNLRSVLQQYHNALNSFTTITLGNHDNQQRLVLDVLTIRDAIQHKLDSSAYISTEQLIAIQHLDDRLQQQRLVIVNAVNLGQWRSLLEPPESAWWWYLEPPALFAWMEKQQLWLNRLDWLWTFLSLVLLSISVSIVLDTLSRVVDEGLSSRGLFPVILQVLLTIAGGSAALTDRGRSAFRQFLTRLRLPKHYQQELSAIASLFIFLLVLGIYQFYLPQLASNRFQDGQAHYQAGQFDSALQAYQQALAIQPDRLEIHYYLGLLHEDLQQMEEAIASYQLVVNSDPDNINQLTWVRAHDNLGRLYLLQGDSQQAWQPLDRALGALPDSSENPEIQAEHYTLLKNMGWLWLQRGQWIEAKERLGQAIELNPKRSAAHCLQAQVIEGQLHTSGLSPTPEQVEELIRIWTACFRGVQDGDQPEEAEWSVISIQKLEEYE